VETTRLSSKGQIVLPKAIRDARGWAAGTEFRIESYEDGIVLRPVKPFPATQLEDVAGSVRYEGPRRSLEDMEKAIAKGVKERRDRGRY
jgi:AbrB family looped-hinge helix DNA binding protein